MSLKAFNAIAERGFKNQAVTTIACWVSFALGLAIGITIGVWVL
jgi:hypothetical protein